MFSLKKQVAICTVGTVLEWYEFTVFASLSPILAELFFPKSNHLSAMLSTFTIFASGYLIRPLGAFFFGHVGDTLGRKYAVLLTIFLMSISTTAIGVIPVGTAFSTMMLVICRLVQGFATSGEYPGALALLAEQAGEKRKGFISSFGIFGTGLGCFVGALAYAIVLKTVGHDQLLAWGWRIPFLLGAPLGILGYLLRTKMMESKEFLSLKQTSKLSGSPIRILFTKHYKTLFAMLGISILANTLVYINFLYFSGYAVSLHKMSLDAAMYLYLLVSFVYAVSILFFGYLSDYFDKKIMIMTACLFLLFFSYPLFYIIINGSLAIQFISQSILSLLLGMILGPFASILAEGFPTSVRYTGLSVTLNIAASFFGGTAPMVCVWLTKFSGTPLSPAFYIMIVSLLAVSATSYLIGKKLGSNLSFTEKNIFVDHLS